MFDLLNYIESGKIRGSVGEHPKKFSNYRFLKHSFQEHQAKGDNNNSNFLSNPNNLFWPSEKYISQENFRGLQKNYSRDYIEKNYTTLFDRISLRSSF